MSQLPTELVALIIDHIPSSDKTTLLACSLAALAFRNPAQRRFNETLKVAAGLGARPVQGSGWRVTFTQAAGHLDKYPHLAQYVRTLNVKFTKEATCSMASIRNVLQRMRHVETVVLSNDWWEQAAWYNMPIVLVGPILGWLSAPPSTGTGTLGRLEIWNFQGLETGGMRCFLHAAPSLCFTNCGIRPANYVGISSAGGKSKLRELEMRRAPQVAALLGQSHLAHVAGNIGTLTLEGQFEDTKDVFPLCLATMPSLETLRVDGYSAWSNAGIVLPAGGPLVFTRLRHLQLVFTRSDMDNANGAVRWFTSGMFFRFSAPALEEVVFRATGLPADGHCVYAPLMDALAAFLRDHGNVRSVEWCIEFAYTAASWEQRRAAAQAFADDVRKWFPREDQEGLLVFRMPN
ncbi:hypothetical protein HMN09_01304900 [Mycena chlorophos]|uniref:F-box domain-containing protein n=1 Tax=Mycena chlorophos TaxID=658473 RepID=A0A8H6S033_MYCCL|nr:hypothetical protein HMN09_01304900 [Mycena chlorophos]